jgi:hypothetical protein
MIVDGDQLLRDLRLPYYTIAILRNMKVGDRFELFDVCGPSMFEGGDPSSASAGIERVKGGHNLSALWMLHIGNARRRGHLWASGVKLKLLAGRRFEILTESDAGEAKATLQSFVCICRLAHRLAAMATAAGDLKAAWLLRPMMTNEVADRYGHEIGFLNSIAARPLPGLKR